MTARLSSQFAPSPPLQPGPRRRTLARAAALLFAPLLALIPAFAYGGVAAVPVSTGSPGGSPGFPGVAGSVWLEDFTWTELRDAIAGGSNTILVPIGGTEQTGPAIALGKHNARVRVLAQRIALASGHALVAPVLAYVPEGSLNPPSGHLRFPGTLGLPPAVFRQVLMATARSLRLHGFKWIVLLGDHGGYQGDLRSVATDLNREWNREAPVAGVPGVCRVLALGAYYEAAGRDFPAWLKGQGYSAAEIGEHGGLADAALTLALAPGLVRRERLDSPAAASAEAGVNGNPARATAELGLHGVDMIVRRSVTAIDQWRGPRP